MYQIEDFEKVWDNSSVSPELLSGVAIDRFRQQSDAVKVVGATWKHGGVQHFVPYYCRPLKDRTGIVHYENGDLRSGRLVVLNGDATRRVVIGVPRVDEHSRPEEGYLTLPPSSACFGGIEWGCEGNDGYTDYLFDFDWNTGALIRYARPTHSW